MTQLQKLTELLDRMSDVFADGEEVASETIAGYLIAHGVVVLDDRFDGLVEQMEGEHE